MATATLYRHRWLLIRAPIALLALLAAWLLWAWLYPMPAARLTLSAGQADGAYHLIAQRYKPAFARHGIELTVLESDGSAHNLERLRATPSAADLALVQGGFGWSAQTAEAARGGTIQTLSNVDIEAIWIFSRQRDITSLVQLRGLRVAAGPAGSGHRVMANRLLAQQRLRPEDVRYLPLSGLKAGEALLRDEVDVVFMVASPDAPSVRKLLAAPGVHLAALQRTVALSERNNFLESRLLAQDALGPGQPPRDLTLLTTHTHLVARQDLDPSLKRIATAVAMEVHTQAGAFHRSGDFPSLRRSDFPSAPEARGVMSNGLNWLERSLPFWWVQVLERLLIVCIPLTVLAWWLAMLIPAMLRWKLESRVTRWYGELKFIENDLEGDSVSGIDLSRFNSRLAKMESSISTLKLPKELAQRWYTLHQHVDFVRQRVYRMRGR